MHPVEALRDVESGFNARGETFQVLEPLSQDELRELRDRGVHVPESICDLLLFAGGVDLGIRGEIRFFGPIGDSGHNDLFPRSIVLGNDDFGNEALVDLAQSSDTWGPVFYICHDPPVVVIQSPTLTEFISALASENWGRERSFPSQSIEQAIDDIWARDPYSQPADKWLEGPMAVPRDSLAALLPDGLVTDLRESVVGSGFSWGRFGHDPIELRLGDELLFGVAPRGGRWFPRLRKLFRRGSG